MKTCRLVESQPDFKVAGDFDICSDDVFHTVDSVLQNLQTTFLEVTAWPRRGRIRMRTSATAPLYLFGGQQIHDAHGSGPP